jgi:hypothetical protein
LQAFWLVVLSRFASLAFILLILLARPVLAAESYLFGTGARSAFAPVKLSPEEQWNKRFWYGSLKLYGAQDFREISNHFGREEDSELRILVKNRSLMTLQSIEFVSTLSKEKAVLMKLYGLTNREYNRLAAMSFGILGRETEFGSNFKYYVKENVQPLIWMMKALEDHTLHPEKNSRGLTQIKTIPEKILEAYCIRKPRELRDPRKAAVATLGFLAESLDFVKHRSRSRHLTYINDDNIFDYVFYVYFGSLRQLANPKFDALGRQVNETATPERNLYLQTVKGYLQGLVLLEAPRAPRVPAPGQSELPWWDFTYRNSTCRVPAS